MNEVYSTHLHFSQHPKVTQGIPSMTEKVQTWVKFFSQ